MRLAPAILLVWLVGVSTNAQPLDRMISVAGASTGQGASTEITNARPLWLEMRKGVRAYTDSDKAGDMLTVCNSTETFNEYTASRTVPGCAQQPKGIPVTISSDQILDGGAPGAPWYGVFVRADDSSWSGWVSADALQPHIPAGTMLVVKVFNSDNPVRLAPKQDSDLNAGENLIDGTVLEFLAQDPKANSSPFSVTDKPRRSLHVKIASKPDQMGWLFSSEVEVRGGAGALMLKPPPSTPIVELPSDAGDHDAKQIALCATVARRLSAYAGAPINDTGLAAGFLDVEWPNLFNAISIGCNSGDDQKKVFLRTGAQDRDGLETFLAGFADAATFFLNMKRVTSRAILAHINECFDKAGGEGADSTVEFAGVVITCTTRSGYSFDIWSPQWTPPSYSNSDLQAAKGLVVETDKALPNAALVAEYTKQLLGLDSSPNSPIGEHP